MFKIEEVVAGYGSDEYNKSITIAKNFAATVKTNKALFRMVARLATKKYDEITEQDIGFFQHITNDYLVRLIEEIKEAQTME